MPDGRDRAGPGPASFERFYADSFDQVYRALAVALGDVHLAREAADEGMARAFVSWAKVSGYDRPAGGCSGSG
ncbi:hypothetical protein [Actinoplanes sp. NPDC051851]|uniref:hypothetical protein n=1 Tax=Actinoplanes sp. NPDC051851 TaxID=3154753 RepID=UPI00343B4727